jgi:hypothetical protein
MAQTADKYTFTTPSEHQFDDNTGVVDKALADSVLFRDRAGVAEHLELLATVTDTPENPLRVLDVRADDGAVHGADVDIVFTVRLADVTVGTTINDGPTHKFGSMAPDGCETYTVRIEAN